MRNRERKRKGDPLPYRDFFLVERLRVDFFLVVRFFVAFFLDDRFFFGIIITSSSIR